MTSIIEVERLSYRYPGGREPAIRGLSFSVGRAEVFGFLGPSGSGKSTTQKILIGLLRGYQGRARVLGRDLADWRRADYERVGIMPELPNHFRKLTARENLAYFAGLYRGPTYSPDEVLELVDLRDAADRPAELLSKGMQGRLSLARALIHRPELLFLDEPTAGQDPARAQRIKQIIETARQAGTTVFLTTHDMVLADQLCDRVALLAGGVMLVVDAPRALRLRYGAPAVRVEFRDGRGSRSREFALAGLADDQEFQGLLRSGGLETIHSREATLEDVFLQMTGRALVGEEQGI
jgi:fluoroquinolone transport system ATP-binding protein